MSDPSMTGDLVERLRAKRKAISYGVNAVEHDIAPPALDLEAADEIERLTRERDEAQAKFSTLQDMDQQALDEGLVVSCLDHSSALDRIAVLEAALRPFADLASAEPDNAEANWWSPAEHFRAARNAMVTP